MAKVYSNIFVRELLGAGNGQFVSHKTRSGKTVVANKAMFDDNRVFIEEHSTQQEAILEATTYAALASRQDVYANLEISSGATAYNLAIADWFGVPTVLEINVDAWTGQAGQTIRVKARDNVMVARVAVVIRDAEENVLEAGEAVQSEAGSAWWKYTTQALVNMEPFPIVEAIAQDLPGNSDSFAIS